MSNLGVISILKVTGLDDITQGINIHKEKKWTSTFASIVYILKKHRNDHRLKYKSLKQNVGENDCDWIR